MERMKKILIAGAMTLLMLCPAKAQIAWQQVVYRLKVQPKAVQLFLALQRNAETCFTILYGTHNFIRQFRQCHLR